jgi:hypothetical protein
VGFFYLKILYFFPNIRKDEPLPILPSVMPAYIPLNSLEIEKKSPPQIELKLRPSFLS